MWADSTVAYEIDGALSASERSAVITAMLGKARALGAVRVSLGEDLSSAELERAKAAFFQALGRSQG